MRRSYFSVRALLALFVLFTCLWYVDSASAATTSIFITEDTGALTPPSYGYVFLDKTVDVNYGSGPVVVASTPDGTGSTVVDDEMIIEVTRPDGTAATLDHDYSSGCGSIRYSPPLEIAYMLQPGVNHVRFQMKDRCGSAMSSSPMYIVMEAAPPPPDPDPMPTPAPDPEPAPSGARVTSVTSSVSSSTPLWNLDLTVKLAGVVCPAKVSISLGDWTKKQAICATGETAPSDMRLQCLTLSATWHGAGSVVDALDSIHLELTGSDITHIDLRGVFGENPLPEIQQTRYFGYPHPYTSGQDKMAAATVRALRQRAVVSTPSS